MKKRIGIDARLINQTGVGTYTRNLLKHLETISKDDIQFYVYLRSADVSSISFKKSNFVVRTANFQWHTFAEQVGFLSQINADKLDLMHFTYFSYPMLYRQPFIITIHDLIPLLMPTGKASTHGFASYTLRHQAYKMVMRNAIHNAQSIIVPSQAVKNDIKRAYGAKWEDKITVVYEGVDEDLQNTDENKSLKSLHSTPFYIRIGNYYPHKNVERLVRAFAKVKNDAQLILIGPDDYFTESVRKLIVDLGQQDRIVIRTHVSTADLVYYYKHAIALIQPSLAEGFGLPLIEAGYHKCPVIASDIPVFREVLGDNYCAFDPSSTSDMTKTIEHCKLKVPELKESFSFIEMAMQTYTLYMSHMRQV